MTLNSLLCNSCVKIGLPNLFNTFGSGFFIDENHILTCYHCIMSPLAPERLSVIIKDKTYNVKYVQSEFSEKYDVALLEIEQKFSNAVMIDDEVESDTRLSYFGYSEENTYGETVTLTCEGESFADLDLKLLKLKEGQVRMGHSGAPVLNLKTGYVVGMIRETRDSKSYSSGGYAIPMENILKAYPSIISQNMVYNSYHDEWKKANISNQGGIYIHDKTRGRDHFLLNNKYPIEILFVEPRYKIVTIENFDSCLELSTSNDIIGDCFKILEQFRLLLILGSYGTGKTILSKMLQQKMLIKNYKTLFINCADVSFLEEYDDFHKYVSNAIPKNKPLYIFFDGYDELNFLGNNNISLIGKFLENIIRITNEENIFIILNSRNIPKKDEVVYENVNLQFDEIRQKSIQYIVLGEFGNDQLEKFMDSFASLMAQRNVEKRIYPSDLKKYHKYLKQACYNPLFIYWFEISFYDNKLNHPVDLYDIYDSFVRNTINGKFAFRSTISNRALDEIKDKYKYFIRKLASEILVKNRTRVKFDTTEIHEFYLDDNNFFYDLDNKIVSDDIKIVSQEILNEEVLANISARRLKENILTCYFLECYGGRWRFKDNNLLFFLIAETYFEKLSSIISNIKNTIGMNCVADTNSNLKIEYRQLYESFKFEKQIPLHPLSIEFLFQKIDKLDGNDKEILWTFIFNLIKEKEILQINERYLQSLDLAKINIDLLLLLIFKRINNKGFVENQLIYFFKRYNWLISAAKIINRNYLHLAQRFFKESNLNNVELRRINFTGYNFDFSFLNSVTFIQDKMYDVRMSACRFQKVEFYLCDFENITIEGMKGNFQMSNCVINKMEIISPDNSESIGIPELEFKNCQIKSLQFKCESRAKKYESNIIFRACDIGNMLAKNMVFNEFKVINCIVSKFVVNENLINDYTYEKNIQR